MTTVIEIVPGGSGYFLAGEFDTRKRYLRNRPTATTDNFAVPKGLTFKVVQNGAGGPPQWRWTDGVNSAHYEETGSPISYDPAYTLVYL